MINEKRISMMKPNVVIVNAARGGVVNDRDIVAALKERKIAAFGSDVYTKEPFDCDHPFYEIKDFSNVMFTPHAAWGAYEARVRCINIICDNIKSYLSGREMNRVV